MPSVRQLKRRIKSVQNTSKITKAMSMIAASKMRRAQEAAINSRPYAVHMKDILMDVSAQIDSNEFTHPLLAKRQPNTHCLILITPDRGLTGGLNSNINRRAGQFILDHQQKVGIINVGKKGRDFMARSGQDIKAVFTDIGDKPTFEDIGPIANIIIDEYTQGRFDQVFLCYTSFVTTTLQEPGVKPLLPIELPESNLTTNSDYIYEPSASQVLTDMLPRFVAIQIYHAILESIASEQSARMVAMRNATDNANQMVDDLTLLMNKVRQESITKELLDIIGGVAAVEN